MNVIRLLRIGNLEEPVLRDVIPDIAARFQAHCELVPEALDPEFAYRPDRQQYHSTAILARMQGLAHAGTWRLLGVTRADLFVPVLTFVFGEAQLGNTCAVVSISRLRQEFYGLPPEPGLVRERLVKEAVHELGHTLGLRHCSDYGCAMAPSHSVEWIDVKGPEFCPACQSQVLSACRGDKISRSGRMW